MRDRMNKTNQAVVK